MQKQAKEIGLLAIAPLILMSISPYIIGTPHMVNQYNGASRILKMRQDDATNMQAVCNAKLCDENFPSISNLNNI